jgi:hypothetical protein
MNTPLLVDLSNVCPQLLAQQRAWLDEQPAAPERDGLQSLLDYLADRVIYHDPAPQPTRPCTPAAFHVQDGCVDQVFWFCSADCLRAGGLLGQPGWLGAHDACAPHNVACRHCGRQLTPAYTPAGQLAIWAPTYWGRLRHLEREEQEFSLPYTRLTAIEETGLRILLGGGRVEDTCDDLLIERHPHGWLVILHRQQDPRACLYIHDDGRTFFQPEQLVTPAAEVLGPSDEVPGFTRENP